jgi:exodeoxyribonuclease-1
MLLRYRARNWPKTLNAAERAAWEEFRRYRLTDPNAGGSLTLDVYRETLARLSAEHAADPARLALLAELAAWADGLLPPGH